MSRAASVDLSQVTWRKSTRSSGGGSNCVEVAYLPGHIAIRDSKSSKGATLIVPFAGFCRLTDTIKRGASAQSAQRVVETG
jgi:hypothetical protein